MKKLLLVVSTFVLIFLNLRMFGAASIDERGFGVPFFNVVKRDPDRERIMSVKIKLEHALSRFRRRPGFGQLGLQEVLNLVDAEVAIVDNLLDGATGYHMERVVNERNRLVASAVPVVLDVYDHVLNLATMDVQLEQKIRDSVAREKNRLACALNYYDKETFLLRMASVLDYYYEMIEDIQYALSKVV